MVRVRPLENPFETPKTELISKMVIKSGQKNLLKVITAFKQLVDLLNAAQEFFIALTNYSYKPFNLQEGFLQLTSNLKKARTEALNLMVLCDVLIRNFHQFPASEITVIIQSLQFHKKQLSAQTFVDVKKSELELAKLQSFLRDVLQGRFQDNSIIKLAIAYEVILLPLPRHIKTVRDNKLLIIPEIKQLNTPITALDDDLVKLEQALAAFS